MIKNTTTTQYLQSFEGECFKYAMTAAWLCYDILSVNSFYVFVKIIRC